jgi:hypothetical protein
MKSDMNMPIAASLTLLTTMHCSIPPCLAARRKATPETQRQSKIVGTKPGLQSRNSAKLVGIESEFFARQCIEHLVFVAHDLRRDAPRFGCVELL